MTFTCILYSDTCLSICGIMRCLQENEHPGIRTANMLLNSSRYQLLLQPVLLLGLLQYHVCLCEFGLQQLLFQISVFEDLLQVLQRSQIKSLTAKTPHSLACVSVCDGVSTASRWSYFEMSPLSFSARALFSWHSLVLRLLCSSIWA